MKDAELRTGLTAKEVGQFGFAARAVGQDVSIFERMMRGFDAPSRTPAKRARRRAPGLRFGVDIQGVRTGMVPPRRCSCRWLKGLEGCRPDLTATRVAMDLFKRAGIEAIPVMDGLRERVDRAKGTGLRHHRGRRQEVRGTEPEGSSSSKCGGSRRCGPSSDARRYGQRVRWVMDKIARSRRAEQAASQAEQQQHAARCRARAAGRARACRRREALQQQMNQYKPGVMDWVKVGVAGSAHITGSIFPYGKLSSNAEQYGQATSQASVRELRHSTLSPTSHSRTRRWENHPPAPATRVSSAAVRQARRELAGTSTGARTGLRQLRQSGRKPSTTHWRNSKGRLVRWSRSSSRFTTQSG
jgi:hypothetical protein